MIVAIAMLVNAGLTVVCECYGDLIGATPRMPTPPWHFESMTNFGRPVD
jgi:hypothetical protein